LLDCVDSKDQAILSQQAAREEAAREEAEKLIERWNL
jgi:hypothetical protein